MKAFFIDENNSLKSNIENLLKWCEKKEKNEELGRTYFNNGILEEKITKWEEENGVSIPKSYKDWLRFSEECQIDGNTATFWGPDRFNSNYVPEDLVVIGEVIGDGEVVCFSKSKGEFVNYFEGSKKNERKNFAELLEDIIDDKPILSQSRLQEILAQIAMKERENK